MDEQIKIISVDEARQLREQHTRGRGGHGRHHRLVEMLRETGGPVSMKIPAKSCGPVVAQVKKAHLEFPGDVDAFSRAIPGDKDHRIVVVEKVDLSQTQG